MKALSYKIQTLIAVSIFAISSLALANPPCENSFTEEPPNKEAELIIELYSNMLKDNTRNIPAFLEFPPLDLESLKKLVGEAMREGNQKEQVRWLRMAFRAKEESVIQFLLDNSEIIYPDQKQLFMEMWLDQHLVTLEFSRDYKRAIKGRLRKPKKTKDEKEAIQTEDNKEAELIIELYSEIVMDNIRKHSRHLLEYPPSDLESLKKLAGEAMREGEQREQMRWLRMAFRAKEESVLRFLLDNSEITNPDQKQLFMEMWLNQSVTTYYFARDYKKAINGRLGKPRKTQSETEAIQEEIDNKLKPQLPSELHSAIVDGDISSFLAVFKDNEYSIRELRTAAKLVRSSLSKPLVQKANIERKKLKILSSMIELVDPITDRLQTNELVKAVLDEDLNFIKKTHDYNYDKYDLREIKIAIIVAEGQEDQIFQNQDLKLMIYYLNRMESKNHAKPTFY